ncbi:MAG TPA: hypothetical protein VGC14_05340 [Rhizobium sp.]
MHRRARAFKAVNWLALAASPTFAIMALLMGILGGPADICSTGQNASALSGMTFMYLLMSVFHVAPWLKLASSLGSSRSRRSDP